MHRGKKIDERDAVMGQHKGGQTDRSVWSPTSLAFVTLLGSLFVFRRVLGDFSNLGIGLIGDSRLFIWSIDYVAHEVRHGRFPWMVSNIYPQIGSVHFFSDTTIPGVGFLLLPVTLIFGAVAAHNVSYIVAPVIAALVTRRLAEVLGLSRRGSFVAGISMAGCPYMAAHALGHANLIHLWIVPLAALGFAHLSLGNRRSAIVCLVLSYGGGLWFSSELVAIDVIIGALGFVDVFLFGLLDRFRARRYQEARSGSKILDPGGQRAPNPTGSIALRSPTIVRTLAISVGLAVVIGIPVLYGNFRAPNHFAGKRHQLANTYVTDGLNIVVPTAAQAFSTESIPLGNPPVWNLKIPFTGGIAEESGYLSIFGVLLLVLRFGSWFRRNRTVAAAEQDLLMYPGLEGFAKVLRPAGLLDRLTIVALVLSIGPRLHLWGKDSHIRMPFFLVDRTPVLRSILSGRISAVVALGFAIMLAAELSRTKLRKGLTGIGLLALLLQLPTATFPSHVAGPDSFMLADYTAAKCQKPAGRRTRVLIVPNYESNMGFSWLQATHNEIELVRTRWFARNYRVDGREFNLDVYLKGSGGVDDVVNELAELKVDCIVVIPKRLTPHQTEMMKPIFDRWSN
jgi:hypothetical protein